MRDYTDLPFIIVLMTSKTISGRSVNFLCLSQNRLQYITQATSCRIQLIRLTLKPNIYLGLIL